MNYAIGIDIGGTKIASGIVNQQGDVIQKETVKSDPSDRENMFKKVIECVEQLMNHSSIPFKEIYGIGAGVPGKIDRENGIAVFQNNLPWRNFPFARRIQDHFKTDKVTLDNDVYMAAYAEWKAAQMTDELFVYMTISTGISSSIINAGKFIRGAGFAGEVGLVPVYAPYEEKSIERLEKTAAGPALEKHAMERMGAAAMTNENLFQAFYNKDSLAIALIEDATSSIVQGIYMINSLLDPHKIVFGGSVITQNPILLELIKEKLDSYLIDEQKHILDHLAISQLGNSQGIIGAGLSVLDTFK
ncbi:ROK family protein [Virgibacillus sp. YIM 98842]|jgi:glucokinase|uniref:ROK family protein n=1 Tax=Virgibacillus sp. YIM 98842 TaxID=2663533 RepID=UPI0013DA40D8|nr:ROK family protein [Virgibacillus sp. YIM 98842]